MTINVNKEWLEECMVLYDQMSRLCDELEEMSLDNGGRRELEAKYEDAEKVWYEVKETMKRQAVHVLQTMIENKEEFLKTNDDGYYILWDSVMAPESEDDELIKLLKAAQPEEGLYEKYVSAFNEGREHYEKHKGLLNI